MKRSNTSTRSVRTVAWSTTNLNGPQTQTFQDKDENGQYNYTLTSQLTGSMRLRFNGSNGRVDPGLSVPNIDAASGVSNVNPLNFNPQPTIRTFSSSDTYSGSLDWTATEKTFVNVTTGWYQSNSYRDGGDPFTGTRRTFANSNLTYTAVPEEFRRASGFADNPVNAFNAEDGFKRLNLNADVTTSSRAPAGRPCGARTAPIPLRSTVSTGRTSIVPISTVSRAAPAR